MAKAFAAKVANEVVDEALQIYGGMATSLKMRLNVITEMPGSSGYMRRTDEIQKNVIAKCDSQVFNKLMEIKEVGGAWDRGANILATARPFCLLNLEDVVKDDRK